LRAFIRRFGSTGATSEWLIPLLLAGAYVIEDFRYGNVQFFIAALVFCSLLMAQERPRIAAAALGLGIAVKVWPLFFVPYLAARRDWKVAASALVLAAVLTLLPSIFLGLEGNLDLLRQWARQEFSTQLGESEIWFPNQSLRGALMRYLTVIDYSTLPDSNYPTVHVAGLAPRTVRRLWFVLAGAMYLGLLALARRRSNSTGLVEHGLAFCLLALAEPFTQKYALVVLLWPALAAGRLVNRRLPRILIYTAIGLVLVQPLTPGSAAQRLLQVLGFDFAANLLLAIVMAYCSVKFSSYSSNCNNSVISVSEPRPISTT
jgi:hypothetical protein